MPKFSASDPRYNDLSYKEASRQATRDNMLYNQMKANGGSDDIEYGHSLDPLVSKMNSSKLLLGWVITFLLSIVFLPMYAFIKDEMPIDLGNIPYYIVGGILVIIPIISIIKGTINNIANSKTRKEIEKEKPNIERQIRKLQKNWDDLEFDAKTEKDRIGVLNTQLRLSMMNSDIEKENELKKEIKNSKSKISDIEEKQIEIEEKIEELEDKIY